MDAETDAEKRVEMDGVDACAVCASTAGPRHEREAPRELRLVEAIVEVAGTTGPGLDVSELLHNLAANSVDLLDTDTASVHITDDNGALETVATCGEGSRCVERGLPAAPVLLPPPAPLHRHGRRGGRHPTPGPPLRARAHLGAGPLTPEACSDDPER
ncbi:hypothetical protein GCM10023199_45630 [Actinomycetospora chibensis]